MKHSITLLLFSVFIACSEDKKADCNYITDYYPKIYEAELNYNQNMYSSTNPGKTIYTGKK